jgi:hypothetical protein
LIFLFSDLKKYWCILSVFYSLELVYNLRIEESLFGVWIYLGLIVVENSVWSNLGRSLIFLGIDRLKEMFCVCLKVWR